MKNIPPEQKVRRKQRLTLGISCSYCKKNLNQIDLYTDHVANCEVPKSSKVVSRSDYSITRLGSNSPTFPPFYNRKQGCEWNGLESTSNTSKELLNITDRCSYCNKLYTNEAALADHICNEKDRRRNGIYII